MVAKSRKKKQITPEVGEVVETQEFIAPDQTEDKPEDVAEGPVDVEVAEIGDEIKDIVKDIVKDVLYKGIAEPLKDEVILGRFKLTHAQFTEIESVANRYSYMKIGRASMALTSIGLEALSKEAGFLGMLSPDLLEIFK